MSEASMEELGTYLRNWTVTAPTPHDIDDLTRNAVDAIVEAGMVQYNPNGWDFKLHEKNPDAPRAPLKLMIREAPGVDTDPRYYDRFTAPAVHQAAARGTLDSLRYVLGYPNAGTPIARAFRDHADAHFGVKLEQLDQDKVVNDDGTRELGQITSDYTQGETVLAIDDTATGGDTKIEGWKKVNEHGLTYAGLSLVVARDPLGLALVRERTGSEVNASIHWITVVGRAAAILDLPERVVHQEIDYPVKLFEWNVTNGNLAGLPETSESLV